MIAEPIPPPPESQTTTVHRPSFRNDLQYADELVAAGVTTETWLRNEAWVAKFRLYVQINCPEMRNSGIPAAAASIQVVLAFLAYVHVQNPRAQSRVVAAKRAVNLIRALSSCEPIDDYYSVKMLSKAVAKVLSAPTGQSNAMPIIFLVQIVKKWGGSLIWWHRQVALMALLSMCALARGAGIRSCTRKGVSWIRANGTTYRGSEKPVRHCTSKECTISNCVRGFLLLLPYRKNRQAQPTWIPVAERSATKLLANHLSWLKGVGAKSDSLFIARKFSKKEGINMFLPNLGPNSCMSVQSFRKLLRTALVQCCNITPAQASNFGTHSFRIAAIELLRKNGVSAELRQQMGDWMSSKVALRYLQLDAAAQFEILEQI